MAHKRSIFIYALLLVGLFLVGCVRPVQNTEVLPIDTTTDTTTAEQPTDTTQPTTAETPVPVEGAEVLPGEMVTDTVDTSPRPEDATPTTEQPVETTTAEQPATEQPVDTSTAVTTTVPVTETAPVATTEQPATTPPSEQTVPPTAASGTHIVAAGENLYRIGLQYGVSWVVIAQENNLANANAIVVGQELRIPAATSDDAAVPTPTPTPTDDTTYTVQIGDTLLKIGQSFGVDWRLIAEANGLINPNLILVGDVLKIPTNTPGPSPEFTHTVAPGETLFIISLNYGVVWSTIAEANNIPSPYVIYPSQVLIIPGE